MVVTYTTVVGGVPSVVGVAMSAGPLGVGAMTRPVPAVLFVWWLWVDGWVVVGGPINRGMLS